MLIARIGRWHNPPVPLHYIDKVLDGCIRLMYRYSSIVHTILGQYSSYFRGVDLGQRYGVADSDLINQPSLGRKGLTPPLSLFLTVIAGGRLLSRIPKPSNSLVRMARSFKGLRTSRTMKIRLQVRATAITCFPRPLPSFAPSMIPGLSAKLLRRSLDSRTG